jgi:hypothetical protein
VTKERDLMHDRDKSLRIPKTVDDAEGKINSIQDEVSIGHAAAMARGQRFDKTQAQKDASWRDREWESVCKIPAESSDLIVITVIKKLGAYIILVTQRSPAKFRGVFVNRMQNFVLEALQDLLRANFLRMDSGENKKERENLQKEAIIRLKMLGYVAMVAESAGCILPKQYKQISVQTGEAINLIAAWKRSDDQRWKKNRNGF